MVGNIPARFGWNGSTVDVDTRFLMARGKRAAAGAAVENTNGATETSAAVACEMTKWFDTNYHYIVPEFNAQTTFCLKSDKVIAEFLEARALKVDAKPVLIGPVTYLTLGKVQDSSSPDFNKFTLFESLIGVYQEILGELEKAGATWVQIDEPILSLDLTPEQR